MVSWPCLCDITGMVHDLLFPLSPHMRYLQVRTENPGEANLFYVPFLPMYRYFRERPHQQV